MSHLVSSSEWQQRPIKGTGMALVDILTVLYLCGLAQKVCQTREGNIFFAFGSISLSRKLLSFSVLLTRWVWSRQVLLSTELSKWHCHRVYFPPWKLNNLAPLPEESALRSMEDQLHWDSLAFTNVLLVGDEERHTAALLTRSPTGLLAHTWECLRTETKKADQLGKWTRICISKWQCP